MPVDFAGAYACRSGPKPSLRIADVLTALTTRGGSLATGAPTSARLLNLILHAADSELARLAAVLNLSVTRYIDNIDFSGRRSCEAIGPTIKILGRKGLAVRHKKVFNSGCDKPHVVTKYNVNGRRPSLAKPFRDKARAACHHAILAKSRGELYVVCLKSLRGRLAYVRMTNPGTADYFVAKLRAAGISI